jgi:hypothetical protein
MRNHTRPKKGPRWRFPVSGERVSNTWVICPKVGNNSSKGLLIPHVVQRWTKGTQVSL